MSADDDDRKPSARETSPLLALTGTEQTLPLGGHAAFVAHAAANPDERLVGARAPETAVPLGDFSLNGVMYFGAKMMVAPKTFEGKHQVLTGWHFKRMRYTRPMRVPDKDAQPVFSADGRKRKATDRVRTECWSFVGGVPVQTAEAALRLKAYLLKVGFYTAENRAVLTLLDTHCEGFFTDEKAHDAVERRKKREVEEPATKHGEPGVGAAMAARTSAYHAELAGGLGPCGADWRGDGRVVGVEYVFSLLGPASPASRYVRELSDVRETFPLPPNGGRDCAGDVCFGAGGELHAPDVGRCAARVRRDGVGREGLCDRFLSHPYRAREAHGAGGLSRQPRPGVDGPARRGPQVGAAAAGVVDGL
jgi:hypothetical protein